MSLLDSIMGQMGGGVTQMIEQQVAGAVAQKMGLDPAMVQTALGALLQQHPQPNDTVQAAAEQTGIAPDMMSQILGQIGGEGALGQIIGAATQQQGGEGGLGGVLGGLVGGMLGGQKS